MPLTVVVLPVPGPPRQNDESVPRRRRNGLLLLLGIRELAVVKQAVQQVVHIEIILVIALGHIVQHMREIGLGVVHIAQIDRIASRDFLPDEDSLVRKAENARENAVLVELHIVLAQQADGRGRQLVERNEGVAVAEVEGQRVNDAGVRAVVREQRQAELHRKSVRKAEIDVVVRVAQQIRGWSHSISIALS